MKAYRAYGGRGFTLIELMIVVIIIAALASMVVPSIMNRADQAKEQIATGEISSITTALKLYKFDNGNYPTTSEGLEALMTKPTSARKWKGPYLEKRPIDPWEQPYEYRYPSTHSTVVGFDIFSRGKDGQADTGDDVGNWE